MSKIASMAELDEIPPVEGVSGADAVSGGRLLTTDARLARTVPEIVVDLPSTD